METRQNPSFSLAASTFFTIICIIIVGMLILELDVHTLLIIAIAVAMIVGKSQGYTFDEMIQFMVNGLSKSMSALFIFIMIGAVVGSWIKAGTVPALIYYGLNIIGPTWFLPAGLILCSIMSVACGTSWGTVGTLGVALIGIGSSLGIPLPIVAGMVVSGACFGDKMSPVSDTTNLASMAAEADLYDHIRAMLLTTVPTYIIALAAYIFLGLKYGGNAFNPEQINIIQNTLATEFNINLLTLLPIIVTLGLSLRKTPALLAMMSGVFTAVIVAIITQGSSVAEVFSAINYGYSTDTGNAIVNKLLNRGGIQGMMWTFSFSILVIGLSGLLDEINILSVVVEKVTKVIKRPASLVTATIGTTLANCMATGDSYMPIILSGKFFQKAFDKAGMARRMLSRCLEEGSTLTVPLIPWSVTAGFFTGTLGVATLDYFPYAILNWLNPLISIVLAYLGIFIIFNKDDDKLASKSADTITADIK